MFKRRARNRQGSALVLVLMIFSIVSILSISILTVASFSVKSANIYKKRNQAYYLARAGAEAAKTAWLNAEGTKPEGEVDTIYVDENYEFTLVKDKKNIGSIDVTIERIKEDEENVGLGSWRIKSIAKLEGVTAEAVLTSTGVTSIDELNEQYSDGNRIVDIENGEILTGSEYRLNSEEKGSFPYNRISRHKEIRGTLVVDIEPEKNETEQRTKPIKFEQDSFVNDLRHIAITAQNIFLYSPLQLHLTGEVEYFLFFPIGYKQRQGALIISAETVVFKESINVKYNNILGWLTPYRDYGMLILNLPDGLGFTKYEVLENVSEDNVNKIRNDSEDERYGRVYFMNSVNGANDSNPAIESLSGKAFYFRKSDTPIVIGDDRNPLEKLIPMKDINPVPEPETSPVFFWN
ncbi:MAG: hypothetical protein GXY96_09040 [Tissierellia bacterium]|nr:hypothetical protein [Tissierellia bacterium]